MADFFSGISSFFTDAFTTAGTTQYSAVGGGTWSKENQTSFKKFFFEYYGAVPYDNADSKNRADNMFTLFIVSCFMNTPSESAEDESNGFLKLIDYDLVSGYDADTQQGKNYAFTTQISGSWGSYNKARLNQAQKDRMTILLSNKVFREWRKQNSLYRDGKDQTCTLRNFCMDPDNMEAAFAYFAYKYKASEYDRDSKSMNQIDGIQPERVPMIKHTVLWKMGTSDSAKKVASAIKNDAFNIIYCLEPMNYHPTAPDGFIERGFEVVIEKKQMEQANATLKKGKR